MTCSQDQRPLNQSIDCFSKERARSGLGMTNALSNRMQNAPMPKNKRTRHPKSILRLPDLEHSKSAVLNSLPSPSSQRSYDHAIREFIEWYCSEPRLAFNKTVVTRYRIFLEQANYASSTINLRLAAVRRLAYEASDAGLLSSDLAAGIRTVRAQRNTAFALAIGSQLTKDYPCSVCLTAIACVANVTTRWWQRYLVVVSGGPSWRRSRYENCRDARNTGFLPTSWAKEGIYGPYRFRIG
jgi:hypothetical protein